MKKKILILLAIMIMSANVCAQSPGYIGWKWIDDYLKLKDAVDSVDIDSVGMTGIRTALFTLEETPPDYQEGMIYYDDNEHTLTLFGNVSGTSMQIGLEMWEIVYNNSGGTISDGQLVYHTTTTGVVPRIALAKADDSLTSKVIGMATHDISINSMGVIATHGIVRDLNVNTTDFDDHDQLYLSADTAGSWIATKPDNEDYFVVPIGRVMKAHASVGAIYAMIGCNVSTSDVHAFDSTVGEIIADSLVYKSGETYREILDDVLNAGVLDSIHVVDEGSLTISWSAGEIYDPDGNIVAIDADVSEDCTNNLPNYLYWSSGTTLTLSTSAPGLEHVSVATIFCQEGDILAPIHIEAMVSRFTHQVQHGFQELFPVMVATGLVVSGGDAAGTDLDVECSAGEYYLDAHDEQVIASLIESETTHMKKWFIASGGAWTSYKDDLVTVDYWDNGSADDSTALANNRWTRAIFLVSSTDTIHYIMGQASYASEAGAIAGPNPTTPPGLAGMPIVTALVIKKGETDFSNATFLDIRPRLNSLVEGAGGEVSDHSSLTNLGADDHPLYALKSGDTMDSLKVDTIVVVDVIRIPTDADPTTAAEGELAWDSDDDALEAYDGTRSVQIASASKTKECLIWSPDAITDTVPMMELDSIIQVGGIVITNLSVLTSVDGDYLLKFFSFTSADPPVLHDYVDTLVVASDAQFISSNTFEDTNAQTLDVGQRLYFLTPDTDIDWIKIKVRYYIKDNN